jgi:ABC-2 type transport system permease protein
MARCCRPRAAAGGGRLITYRASLLGAFLRRDWATARSYRFAFVLQIVDSTLQLSLFFFLGRIVDTTTLGAQTNVSGGYFPFVIVGLVLMELVYVGVTSFARQIRRDQTTGTLEALLVAPAPQTFVIIGSAAFDFVRAIGLGLLMLVLGVVVFGLDLSLDAGSIGILAIVLPSSLAFFAGVGVALAAGTIVFKQVDVLVGFASLMLALFGGVYFPIQVLPAPLEALAHACPLTWALDGLRAALLGGHVPTAELALLPVAGALAIPLSFIIFRAALDHARRAGSLAQY